MPARLRLSDPERSTLAEIGRDGLHGTRADRIGVAGGACDQGVLGLPPVRTAPAIAVCQSQEARPTDPSRSCNHRHARSASGLAPEADCQELRPCLLERKHRHSALAEHFAARGGRRQIHRSQLLEQMLNLHVIAAYMAGSMYGSLCWPRKPSECKKLRASKVLMLKTGHLETGLSVA